MKKNLSVSLLWILCAISVFSQSKEEKKIIIETIIENDNKLEGFFKQGKADSIAALFSPNSHLIVEYKNALEKREVINEYYNKLFKSGIDYSEFALEAVEYKVYDELVLEIGQNKVKYSKVSDGKAYSKKYNYILVWKKSRDGKYQIRAAMWNSAENPCE